MITPLDDNLHNIYYKTTTRSIENYIERIKQIWGNVNYKYRKLCKNMESEETKKVRRKKDKKGKR